MPFLSPLLGEGSPTKIDYRKQGTLILTSLLEVLLQALLAGAHQGMRIGMTPISHPTGGFLYSGIPKRFIPET